MLLPHKYGQEVELGGKVRPREGLSLEGFDFDVFPERILAHTHLLIRKTLLFMCYSWSSSHGQPSVTC